MPLESSHLFQPTEHLNAGLPNGKAALTLADVRTLQETLARFKSVGVDPAEFACLKAIALFKAGKYSYFYNIINICRNEFHFIH